MDGGEKRESTIAAQLMVDPLIFPIEPFRIVRRRHPDQHVL